jgi:uncharacterized RDD family membrane protein YckC
MEENTIPSVFDEMESAQLYFEHATPAQRFANLIVDAIVYYLLYTILIFIIASIMVYSGHDAEEIRNTFSNKAILYPLSYLVYSAMYFFSEGITKGHTLGKLITRTRAVKEEDLSPITWKDAFIRTIIRLIPIEAFSAFSGNPWHDKWSKTYVIKKRRAL